MTIETCDKCERPISIKDGFVKCFKADKKLKQEYVSFIHVGYICNDCWNYITKDV